MGIAKNHKKASNKTAKKAANRVVAKKASSKAAAKPGASEAKLDVSKLQRGEYVSCHQYMQVVKIRDDGTTVDLRRADGKVIDIYKSILRTDAYSAEHYEQTVTCNMTELSEILQSAQDTIFTVEFNKKNDEKVI